MAACLDQRAAAEPPSWNVDVAARALSFVEPRFAGPTPLAVVYQAGDPDSERDARQIAAGIERAPVRGVSFQPHLVAAGGEFDNAKIVFVARGIRNQAGVAAAAARVRAVTVSFDMGCVATGRCVIGVQTQPRVQIVVSRAARAASGVRFSQAFLMLVSER